LLKQARANIREFGIDSDAVASKIVGGSGSADPGGAAGKFPS
jgi:hypothetical protein